MTTPADGWMVLHEGDCSRTLLKDNGDGTSVIKVEHYGVQEVLDHNAEFRAATASARWGEGAIIGRVPLSLYYASGLAEARKNGDEAWIRRFWNDSDHAKLRTKEGNI